MVVCRAKVFCMRYNDFVKCWIRLNGAGYCGCVPRAKMFCIRQNVRCIVVAQTLHCFTREF